MEKIQIHEIRQKLGKYRVAMSNVIRSFNKHQNFPQEAKDQLMAKQAELNEIIKLLDEVSNESD